MEEGPKHAGHGTLLIACCDRSWTQAIGQRVKTAFKLCTGMTSHHKYQLHKRRQVTGSLIELWSPFQGHTCKVAACAGWRASPSGCLLICSEPKFECLRYRSMICYLGLPQVAVPAGSEYDATDSCAFQVTIEDSTLAKDSQKLRLEVRGFTLSNRPRPSNQHIAPLLAGHKHDDTEPGNPSEVQV